MESSYIRLGHDPPPSRTTEADANMGMAAERCNREPGLNSRDPKLTALGLAALMTEDHAFVDRDDSRREGKAHMAEWRVLPDTEANRERFGLT